MLTIGSELRRLDCELSYDEKQARAQRAAEISELAGSEKERATRMKEEAAALLKQSEAHTREASMLLSYYKAEVEPRDIQCDVAFDSEAGDVLLIRTDTRRIIERRKPTHEEWNSIKAKRQQTLSFRSPLFKDHQTELERQAAELIGKIVVPVADEAKPKDRRKDKASKAAEGGVSLKLVDEAKP